MVMLVIWIVLKTMYVSLPSFGKETNIISLAANKRLSFTLVYKLLLFLSLDPELFLGFESE